MTMKFSCSILVAVCLLLLGCDTKTKAVDSCGDNFLDPGEECDGSQLTVNSCTDLGYYVQLAPLRCLDDCTFDLTVCSGGQCGDGNLQVDKGEKCDGENLDEMTCSTLGLGGGILACKANCRFDISRCELAAECGDNVAASPYEPCDGTDLDNQTCESLGFFKGTLACMDDCGEFDTSGCSNCGNGAVDDGETCDGTNLNQQTCASLGYSGGALSCTAACAFDLSQCEVPVTCGNGQLDTGEACDGSALNGQTCVTQGFFGGQLGCRPNCAFDTAGCTNCGNGQLDAGEACDGANLNAQTCQTQGWYGGTLACAANCLAFNDSSCVAAGRCGDGTIQTAQGEECDGSSLGGGTCISEGFYEGTLACGSDCRFVTSGCSGLCGDGIIQATHGEVCEGTDLNGQTCVSQGFGSGTLACNAGCTGFVTTGCSMCGNNLINAPEVCDGSALNGQTCVSQGFVSGTLACNAGCTGFVTTGCSMCGNNTVNSPEVCDGSALNGQTCVSQGFGSGTLACNAGCTGFVTTGCSMCGNNTVNAGEACDGSALNGQTCVSRGYYGGILTCNANCQGFNQTQCSGWCGDGTIQGANGEQCEGSNLAGATCASEGFSARGGTLGCTGTCGLDTSGCIAKSANANLSSLTVSSGTLNPNFSSSTTSYSVTVPQAVTSLTVAGMAADAPYATVAVAPSQPMGLVVGTNAVTVTVTAENGTQKAYTIVIRRMDADYTSSNIGTLIYVPSGTFQRDATATNLSIVSAFRMSQFEITRAQWTAVTGWVDPSDTNNSSGTNDPVQRVSWYDAIAFCNKLSLLEGLTPVYAVSGVNFSTLTYEQIPWVSDAAWNAATANWAANGYRLPTEMEWMWAAMGADTANPGAVNTTGYTKAFAGSTGSNLIGDYAWYTSNSGNKTHPAGTKLPNELGFHDLSGNVRERAWDWNGAYPTGTVTDYRGPASGTLGTSRGGDWGTHSSICSVAARSAYNQGARSYYFGFRVVRP